VFFKATTHDTAPLIAVIWASGRDDALGTPPQHPYYLNERKLGRGVHSMSKVPN
jgi:hypothetical protein